MRSPTMRRATGVVAGAAALALLSACGSAGSESRTTITLFQFKPEAVDFFTQAAADFEAENPDVRVVVDNVPDAETLLRTRLVKDDVPDVMTLNGNGTFGELASAEVFRDWSGDPLLKEVNPAYVDVVQELGEGAPGEVNGIPFAANASGVLYNPEIFAEQGLEVPRTWEEFVATAQTLEKAGVTPVYGTLADAWTVQAALAPLVPQTQPEDFFEQRFAGTTTFEQGWPEALEKLATLYDYTQPNAGSRGYDDGTQAFARGEAAMLVIGTYAIPQVRTFEPDFEIGSFALPATDDPAATTVVSGVDVLLATGRDGEHPEESRRLVEFLLEPERVAAYAEAQVAIPALEGQVAQDPALAGLQPLIDAGRVDGFFDHQFIPAIPLGPQLQSYLLGGTDMETTLAQLDEDWDAVAARRTWGLGAVES